MGAVDPLRIGFDSETILAGSTLSGHAFSTYHQRFLARHQHVGTIKSASVATFVVDLASITQVFRRMVAPQPRLAAWNVSCRRAAFVSLGSQRLPFSGVLTTTISSKLLGAKRVATRELSGFQAGQKPAGALCRSTVGKCVGHNVALGAPLQSIVSNG
jgi:hypothetical protein